VRYLYTPKLITPVLPAPSYYICYMILTKLLKLRFLYTWNIFSHVSFHSYRKLSCERVEWTQSSHKSSEVQGFITRIFDPFNSGVYSYAITQARRIFHTCDFSSLYASAVINYPAACVCTRKFASPDYVNLLERPFSTNAKCSCISIISRCTVCALIIYDIARTYEPSATWQRESFSDMFMSITVLS